MQHRSGVEQWAIRKEPRQIVHNAILYQVQEQAMVQMGGKMTNEQINRAVAEELGWKPYCPPADYLWSLVDRNDNLVGRHKRGGLDHDHCWVVCNLNFCEDHNAVAEIRRAIRPEERSRFGALLADQMRKLDVTPTFGEAVFWLVDRTPREYAIAFLKMRGKWREE